MNTRTLYAQREAIPTALGWRVMETTQAGEVRMIASGLEEHVARELAAVPTMLAALVDTTTTLARAVQFATEDVPDFDVREHVTVKKGLAALAEATGDKAPLPGL